MAVENGVENRSKAAGRRSLGWRRKEEVDGVVGLNLGEDVDRRLTLFDSLEQLEMPLVTRRKPRQLLGEFEQQAEAFLKTERVEILD